MKALRQIAHIKKNSVTLKGLKSINNKTVEIIIVPVRDKTRKKPDIREIKKFNGAASSGYSDTSNKIDSIIYGA